MWQGLETDGYNIMHTTLTLEAIWLRINSFIL